MLQKTVQFKWPVGDSALRPGDLKDLQPLQPTEDEHSSGGVLEIQGSGTMRV